MYRKCSYHLVASRHLNTRTKEKKNIMTPINYADLAVKSMNAGDYLQASILWEKAGWESRGKQKRDFYFAKAQACKEKTR